MLAIKGFSPVLKNPIKPFSAIGAEEKAAINRVLESGSPLSGFYGSPQPRFYGGTEVQSLEEEWRQKFYCKDAISVNSATSGLIAMMGAIGIEPGDEVIVSPYSMSASAIAPLFYGGIPVFADIEPDYFCLDIEDVKRKTTSKTKAILVVNLFGHPAELKKLRAFADEKGIYLIEDNAQAVLGEEEGRLCGNIGHGGVYSMNIHKHIHSGEGGICVTENEEIAQRLKLIRNHGENCVEWLEEKNLSNMIGFNFRQTEIGAALARAQLKKLDPLVKRCEDIAQALTDGLKGLDGLTPPKVREKCRHNYFMWTVKYDRSRMEVSRQEFCEALRAEGVPIVQGYVRPLYHLPLFQKKIAIGSKGFPFSLGSVNYEKGLCPVAERMHFEEVIQFQPVSWDLGSDQIEKVIEAFHKVHDFYSKQSKKAAS